MPNPGRIRIYTSGCPKNQKRCWYRIGSPPNAGSKNEEFTLRSNGRYSCYVKSENGEINRRAFGQSCAMFVAKGGYTVHPVTAPLSITLLMIRNINDGGRSQNLILFIRGNAISGAPSISGTSQFPNPPIIINYEKNYNESVGSNNCIVDLVIADRRAYQEFQVLFGLVLLVMFLLYLLMLRR
ncbi:hypothetical protein ABEB36_013802 [Hypothenemus hampei]|uniref:Ig-like domain-containing protein n=1 Tax=Hypothenemus hampei TaxID=57062 RepID=A0ABD1E821_HYPHA